MRQRQCGRREDDVETVRRREGEKESDNIRVERREGENERKTDQNELKKRKRLKI